MTLFSPETVQTFVAALPAPLPDFCYLFSLGCAYGAQLRPKSKATRYALALGFVSLLFLIIALLDQAIPPTTNSAPIPYRLLGVTTSSTDGQITYAYTKLASRGSVNGTYKTAYKTLTDPLQRCVYHRDNKVPDWYGVPQSCKGELTIEKLQATKNLIRRSKVVDSSFEKMNAAVDTLKGRIKSYRDTTSPAGPVNLSVTEKVLRAPARLWSATVNTARGCSQWFGRQVRGLPAVSLSACLSWLRTQTRALSRSASHCVAAMKQHVVSIPFSASSALWAAFFSVLALVLVWISLNVHRLNPSVHPMAIFGSSTLIYLRFVRLAQGVWGQLEKPAQLPPDDSNSAAVQDLPTA
jgi:hypothetical protein